MSTLYPAWHPALEKAEPDKASPEFRFHGVDTSEARGLRGPAPLLGSQWLALARCGRHHRSATHTRQRVSTSRLRRARANSGLGRKGFVIHPSSALIFKLRPWAVSPFIQGIGSVFQEASHLRYQSRSSDVAVAARFLDRILNYSFEMTIRLASWGTLGARRQFSYTRQIVKLRKNYP